MTLVPHTVESILDLFDRESIMKAIKHQANIDETIEDWEARHIMSAQYLCDYAMAVYGRDATEDASKLLNKLELT